MNVLVTSERPSTVTTADVSGPAEKRFLTAARRHTALTRVVIALAVETLALLVTSAATLRPAVGALVVAATWCAVYLLVLRKRAAAWVIWCDAVLVAAIGLSEPWLDVPYLVADGAGWVLMVLLMSIAMHQWQLPDASKATLAGIAILPIAGFSAGALLDNAPNPAAVPMRAVGPAVLAVVSVAVFRSLRAAARRVDQAATRHQLARAEVEVAAARRVARAEQLAALHDTAAVTLMMVGMGEVGDDEPWLRRQAARDLEVLTGGRRPTGEDVVPSLRPVVEASGLSVEMTQVGVPDTVPAKVAAAVTGAVGEALRNITRHAGVDEARILVDHTGSGIRVEVRDRGTGFTDEAKPRTGRGIPHSITERMDLVGGRATVTSSADGVTVALVWPR